jgi:hypothetical protein
MVSAFYADQYPATCVVKLGLIESEVAHFWHNWFSFFFWHLSDSPCAVIQKGESHLRDVSRSGSPLKLVLPFASQAGEQPRIPPLRAVIMYRDAQRLPLPDQHAQPLAPRDSRIDQVGAAPLQ